MSSNDFESCVIRIELFSNIEGDNSGKISGEEILVSGLEGPVIDFMQLLVQTSPSTKRTFENKASPSNRLNTKPGGSRMRRLRPGTTRASRVL